MTIELGEYSDYTMIRRGLRLTDKSRNCGDNFTLLAGGGNPVDAGLDLDATEAYLATNPPVPVLGRITDLTPKR